MGGKDTGREKEVGLQELWPWGAREWLETEWPPGPQESCLPHMHQYTLGVRYLMAPQEPGAPLPFCQNSLY